MSQSEKRTWSTIDLLCYQRTTIRCIVLGHANRGQQFKGWRSYFSNSLSIPRTCYSVIYHDSTNNQYLCFITVHETTEQYTAIIKV